jgi:hypothetical protein
VKVPISDAAAKTVIVPDGKAELLAAGEDELLAAGEDDLLAAGVELELLLEQPATATAASTAMVRAKRCIVNS